MNEHRHEHAFTSTDEGPPFYCGCGAFLDETGSLQEPLRFHVIHLWSERPCYICDQIGDWRQGLPMYEGEVLPNDWTGEWGGFTVCPTCFAANDDPPAPRAPINPFKVASP